MVEPVIYIPMTTLLPPLFRDWAAKHPLFALKTRWGAVDTWIGDDYDQSILLGIEWAGGADG